MPNWPIAILVLGLAAQTQTPAAAARTDFSGRWAIAAPAGASGAPGRAGATPLAGGRGDMGSGWGSPITITQNATQLTVEYVFFARGDLQPPLKFVYALDGSKTTNTVMMGRGMQTQASTATWDGAKLLITTMHTFEDPATGKPAAAEVKQTLSLESPTTLVVETVRAGVFGGPATSTKTTYQKN